MRASERSVQGSSGELEPISYLSYSDIVARMRRLADQAPELVTMWSAQRTGSRTFRGGAAPPFVTPLPSPGTCSPTGDACEHWFISLTNLSAPVNVSTRAQVFLSGNLHGDEVVGPMTLVYLLEHIIRSARAGNAWTSWLLSHRVIVALPMSNPLGYFNGVREENGVDPNRDFPFQQHPAECMRSITARAINEVWRAHQFVGGVTFHGGMQAIAYEWGAPGHAAGVGTAAYAESPDDASQGAAATVFRAAAGALNGQRYPVGRMSAIVYAVAGGMEDWAYAGSWETAAVQACTPDTQGAYPLQLTRDYAPGALRAFNVLIEAADAKRPSQASLGSWSDATSLVVEGAGDGHVPRNVRLVYAMLDMVEPYVVLTRFAAALVSGSEAGRQGGVRRVQGVTLSAASPIAAVLCPASSASACAHNAHADAYAAWIATDVPVSDCSAGNDSDVVQVRVGWDVGGGMTVDETSLLVGAWDARVSPALLTNASMGQDAVSLEDAARIVVVDAGLSMDEAMNLMRYVWAWQAVLLGRMRVADAIRTHPSILRPSLPRSTVTRWVFGDVGAQPAPLDALPAAVDSGSVQGAPDLARAPFVTRAAECVNITLAAASSIVTCAASTAANSSVTITEAFFVVPYAVLDRAWRAQGAPDPAVSPQTHFANIRSDPSWRFTNGEFEVRGRTHATPEEVCFVAVSRTLRRTQDAQPVGEVTASATPIVGAHAVDAEVDGVACGKLAVLPLVAAPPVTVQAQAEPDPVIKAVGVRASFIVMYAAIVSGVLVGVLFMVAVQLRMASRAAMQYAAIDTAEGDDTVMDGEGAGVARSANMRHPGRIARPVGGSVSRVAVGRHR